MTAKQNSATEPEDAHTEDEAIPHLGDSLTRLEPELNNPTRLGIVSSLKNRDKAE